MPSGDAGPRRDHWTWFRRYGLLGDQEHQDQRTIQSSVSFRVLRPVQSPKLWKPGSDRHQLIVRDNPIDAIPDGRFRIVEADPVRTAAEVLSSEFNQLGEGRVTTCPLFFVCRRTDNTLEDGERQRRKEVKTKRGENGI